MKSVGEKVNTLDDLDNVLSYLEFKNMVGRDIVHINVASRDAEEFEEELLAEGFEGLRSKSDSGKHDVIIIFLG